MQLPIHVLYTLAFTPQVDGLIIFLFKRRVFGGGSITTTVWITKDEHWQFVCCFGDLVHENNIIHIR